MDESAGHEYTIGDRGRGLDAGTTYSFQARAVIQSAYTDWSDSVTLMAT